MRLKLLASILLCASTLAGAGINTWTPIGPAGGSINRIVFGATAGTAFAATSSGFYRSLDAGASWQSIKSDFLNSPKGIAIDPSDASRIYVVAPDWPSLYMSSDGGATLAPVTTLPTAVTQAYQVVVSQDGRTIFVSSGARVFRSADRGVTWIERAPVSVDMFAGITRLVMDPGNANRVYVAATLSSGNYGLLRTQDGGQSWAVLLSGPTIAVLDIAVSASNPLQIWAATLTGLFRSDDQGASWSNVLPGETAGAVAVDPASPGVVYAGQSNGQMFRSTNSGANWTNVTGGHNAGGIATIAVNPAQNARVLLGGNAGLYGSSDSGTTWAPQQAGILGSTISDVSRDASSGRIYIDTSTGGIFHTSSSSASVVPVNNEALKQQAAPQSLSVTKMFAQPGRLWASLATGLARSLDGGNTWTLVQVAPTGTRQLYGLASSVAAPQTLLAAGNSRLFRSTDGGSLWTQITTGIPPSASFGPLIVAPSDGRFAYVYLFETSGPSPLRGIYRSTDGGLTWAPASGGSVADIRPLAVDPVFATTVYGATETTLLASADGGETWSPLSWVQSEWRGSIQAFAVDPLRPETLYAASGSRVARSVDGGTTWETLRDASALPHWSTRILFPDPGSSGNLFVATGQSGVQKITIAPDLILSGTAPAVPTGLGVPLAYRFQFGNQGPFDATGVTMSVQWPASATNVTVLPSSGSCIVGASAATCYVETFRLGSTATVTITATPATAGSFEVSASLTGDQSDMNPANNAVALQTGVTARADLSVTASGTATAQTGDSVSHTVTVRNAGPNTASGPTLSIQLGSGLVLASATPTTGNCTINITTAQANCALLDLASGGSANVVVNSSATVAGSWGLVVNGNSLVADGSAADNSATVSTVVAQAPAPPGGGGGGSGGGGSASGGGGGALSPWEMLALLLGAAYFQLESRRRGNRKVAISPM